MILYNSGSKSGAKLEMILDINTKNYKLFILKNPN